MSATLPYQEPYRFSAGVLALLVHLGFFALMYFGVRWQSHPPEEFTVEMWDTLPNAEVVPEPAPPPPPPPPSPVMAEPAPPPKAVSRPEEAPDIGLREKKSKKAKEMEKLAKKDEKKEKAAARARQEAAERRELEAYAEQRRQTVRQQVRTEVATATKVQVERYQELIRNKIRRKIVNVADVPDTAEVVFKVTLLPDGMLMDDPVLVKSSGYPAYDEAAERAILLAEPLPVPPDVSLQKMFRELELKIRPKE